MSARHAVTMILCALGSLLATESERVFADVEWMTTGGTAELAISRNAVAGSVPGDSAESVVRIDLDIGVGAPIAYYNLYLNEFAYADVPINGRIDLGGHDKPLIVDGLLIRVHRNSLTEDVKAAILSGDGKIQLFSLADAHSIFDPATDTISLHADSLRVSNDLAKQLARPDLAGSNVGSLRASIDVIWSGGDDPARTSDHEFLATIPSSAEPRGGGASPDVVYTNCTNVATYGPVGNMYAYALSSTTCNIGSMTLLWGTSHNGTPALAMNAYRIFDGRLEQIGQGWVKHSCCAAAGSGCGLTCQGGGGSQLGAGCSDVYGAGYNGGQSRLGPRFEINAFTGNITPAPSDIGDAVYKRLQIEVGDMSTANYPGAQYLIEGVYVGSDDAAAGNGWNNASYRMASISQSTFDMTMLDQMHVSVPAIYAWRDHGNGLNTPDNRVEVQQVDVPGEGIFHLASKVTDNGDGTWRFDYAVYNLNSDRSGGSFSVPLGAATPTNIGFKDVDYHSGEPYDNTDWAVSIDGTTITWASTSTYDQDPMSNALRWGTMYNFWFTSDVGPNDELGEVTLGLFKPGTPTSVSATTQVPLAGAVIIRLPSGAPDIVPTCVPTTIAVEMKDGSEPLDAQSARFHYRYGAGAFVEAALTPVGGELYEATLPTPTCADAPEFYFSALSTLGTTVTNPKDAETLQTYLSADVGFPDTLTYLETDFESGLPAGWSQNGLWNVSSSCSGVPTGACEDAGGSNVAYLGQPGVCNYDVGQFINDSMYTPAIALPDADQIHLTYCSAFQRDLTPIGDWPEVRIIPNGGSAEIVDQPAVGAFVGAPAKWESRVVDLTAYAGQTVTLEFNFNNIFPVNDNFLGWQVDNIRVTAPGATCIPGCDGPDGDANGDNVTDGKDIDSIVAAILAQSTDPQKLAALDFNGDGTVDAADVDQIVSALLNQ
ncbi:MAG: hypothetical protein H6819_07665 [Phycisphaerales bacterium]|nr:hypothetical protein [Phycisphaerales bacterium]MCB9857628.1 hypothetical protein [Phycisphaerales bacterium]MCB9864815.1 hypothetical protein [Phycisphaerales bacterium]